MGYRLLHEFERVFRGVRYRHRSSNTGDRVAIGLYEDLYAVGKSAILRERIDSREYVLNTENKREGVKARRGDATFGELVPNERAAASAGFAVARGPIANVEIGVEAKFLMKKMIAQIGRVQSDLEDQVRHFQRGGGRPICVALLAVNYADHCTTYEGDRAYPTDGVKFIHPVTEAAEAARRLERDVAPMFDEVILLRFRATNEEPYLFEWVNREATVRAYGAALTRISREYEARFAREFEDSVRVRGGAG